MASELGLPVARHTMCRVGAHVYVWTSATPSFVHIGPVEPYDKDLHCDCGLTTWRETHPAPGETAGGAP